MKWEVIIRERKPLGERQEAIQTIECFLDQTVARARAAQLRNEHHNLTISIRRVGEIIPMQREFRMTTAAYRRGPTLQPTTPLRADGRRINSVDLRSGGLMRQIRGEGRVLCDI